MTTTEDPADTPSTEKESSYGRYKYLIYGVSILMSLFLIYQALEFPYERARYSAVHFGLAGVLYGLVILAEKDEKPSVENLPLPVEWIGKQTIPSKLATVTRILDSILIGILILASAIVGIYLFLEYDALQFERLVTLNTGDMIVGILMFIVAVEFTRRGFGWILFTLIIFSTIFARFGEFFPGFFRHAGVSNMRLLSELGINFTGILGIVFQIIALWVFAFILYAGILEAFGAIDLFLDIGYIIGRLSRYGIAQTAVVSSMIMGSLSGSAVANTAITGSFTIPMMKNEGLSGRTAAAIESVASVGGQILPPIMASVAFLIANFVGISYADVALAGVLPAIIFYGGAAISVHLYSLREYGKLKQKKEASSGGSKRDIDKRRMIEDGIPVLISFVVLVYVLIIQRLSPALAGIYTTGTFLGLVLLRDTLTKGPVNAVIRNVRLQVEGMRIGATNMAPLSLLIGGLGIPIAIFSMTGFANKIALRLVILSSGVFLITAALVMIVTVLFGMGMPTIPAYLLTATLAVPAMEQVGVSSLAAHMFILYYASLSAITPPIALAVSVGSQISGSDFLLTTLRALVIGAPAFLLPYLFIFDEALLRLSFPGSIYAFGKATAVTLLLIGCLHLLSLSITWMSQNYGSGESQKETP